jgi:hypothetical protein
MPIHAVTKLFAFLLIQSIFLNGITFSVLYGHFSNHFLLLLRVTDIGNVAQGIKSIRS